MPWYKVTLQYGRGNPQTKTYHEWFDEPLNSMDQRYLWNDRAAGIHAEHITGNVEEVVDIPDAVRQEKIQLYEAEVEHAQRMLQLLRST